MSVAVVEDQAALDLRNHRIRMRKHCVIAFYVANFVQGAGLIACHHKELMFALSGLLCGLTIALWARIDAQLRGLPLLRIAQEGLLALGPLAAFVYLVWTRRWRGLGLWLLYFFGWWVAIFLGAFAGALAVILVDRDI